MYMITIGEKERRLTSIYLVKGNLNFSIQYSFDLNQFLQFAVVLVCIYVTQGRDM